MFQNVVLGWFARRALEVGGIVGFLYSFYLALPPYAQAAITRILTGDASPEHYAVALGAIIIAGVGYLWSFRSTVTPQVVTPDKRQIPIEPHSRAADEIAQKAATAPKPRTLWERLTGK